MGASKILTGVIAGAAVGALLGVLFAPAKGTVTRRKMFKMKDDYADSMREEFDEFIDNLSEKFDLVQKGGSDLVEKGRKKADEVKEGVKHNHVS